MVDIKEVAENVILIDDALYSIPEWGSVYLINEEKKALVDTGPTTSVNAVLDGIKRRELTRRKSTTSSPLISTWTMPAGRVNC